MPAQTQQSLPVKKLILFLALTFIFLFAWNKVFPPVPPNGANGAAATEEVAKNSNDGTAPSNSAANNVAAVQQGGEFAPAKSFPVVDNRLSIDGADVHVSNKGGRITSVTITNPKRFSAAGDLLGEFPKDSTHYPFAVKVDDGIIDIPYDYAFEVVQGESVQTDDGYSKIVYRYTDPANRYLFDKIYEVDPDHPYQSNLTVRIKNMMTNAPLSERVSLNVVGYNDPNVEHSFLETRADLIEGVCKLEDDLERKRFDKVDKPEIYDGATMWAAIDRRYFLFAAIPNNMGTECSVSKVDHDYLRATVAQKKVSLKPGETISVSWLLYTGPKNYDLLSDIGHEIRETVDFGMLSFLARPLRWTLAKIQSVVGNWGLAIIVLTILIRLLLWPLNQIAYSQTEKMRRLQPKLNELKEKYKGDTQKYQEEQLRLMRESGTTPFGCLPMFLQFPILLALYFMILNSVELYHADFILWYTNLAARDPYFVLPILMGVTMFLQQHFMTPEMDPSNPAASMQKIMKFMPVIFTAFMLFLPSGVVLYYFVSLLIGLGQQYYIRESLKKKYAELDAEIEYEIDVHEKKSKK